MGKHFVFTSVLEIVFITKIIASNTTRNVDLYLLSVKSFLYKLPQILKIYKKNYSIVAGYLSVDRLILPLLHVLVYFVFFASGQCQIIYKI